MKVTKKQLNKIIREVKADLIKENAGMGLGWGFGSFQPNSNPDFARAYGSDAKSVGHAHQQLRRQGRPDMSEQPARRELHQVHEDELVLKDAFKELQQIIHDASLAMDSWVNTHHDALDAAGELDDPESITIRMDELRIDLKAIADEAYKRR